MNDGQPSPQSNQLIARSLLLVAIAVFFTVIAARYALRWIVPGRARARIETFPECRDGQVVERVRWQ